MSKNTFRVSGTNASFVINGLTQDGEFEAIEQVIAPNMQSQARQASAETVYFIQEGTLEFMVNGATGFVTAGAMVRVAPHAVHSYRNVGNIAVRLFTQSLPASANTDHGLKLVIAPRAA